MLSLASVKELLSVEGLSPDVECRAWTMWAEIGMCVIDGGWHGREECVEWAGRIVGEVRRGGLFVVGQGTDESLQVQTAISKGVSI